MKTATIKFVLSALFAFIAFVAYAQKLPVTQQSNLRAPAKVKIDGKAREWNKFKAYNKSSDIFYSVANDDDNLYLVIQALKPDVIDKIIKGGITFTINSSDKKSDEGGIAITFPVFDKKNLPNINLRNKPQLINDSATYKKQVDSFLYVINKKLADKSKEIGIKGVEAITDNFISVYNEKGFKATTLFDDQLKYTYELAIPIKYTRLSIIDPKQFVYNIKINGVELNALGDNISSGLTSLHILEGGGVSMTGPTADAAMFLMKATDFWGEYTLAK